jgi:hypothetical protein
VSKSAPSLVRNVAAIALLMLCSVVAAMLLWAYVPLMRFVVGGFGIQGSASIAKALTNAVSPAELRQMAYQIIQARGTNSSWLAGTSNLPPEVTAVLSRLPAPSANWVPATQSGSQPGEVRVVLVSFNSFGREPTLEINPSDTNLPSAVAGRPGSADRFCIAPGIYLVSPPPIER